MHTKIIACTGVLAVLGLVGCSEESTTAQTAPETTTQAAVDGPTEAGLRQAADSLNAAITRRDAATAWGHYSQRCQSLVGSQRVYEIMLENEYKGRNPSSTVAKVTVNGASGQVVSVDSDPAAPASSSAARTWTFISGKWQFDAC
ncbi:hypothetical protein [Nocardia abscessus]|uniref:hypothetical protein n=1 Tax=Nocardia abscessus TaxID=120957 RepID=UPI002453F3D9|nr:hypothetical protein [Nocardia abscessus]